MMHPLRSKEGRKRRKKRRRPINVLASVLTTFSLYCGVASMFATVSERYEKAAWLILAAIVFDMLDGSVAKLTHSMSEFGKQLDSLSDLVSAGTAPAILIYKAYLMEETGFDRIGSVVAVIFVICAALRLARYTLYQSDLRDYFVGLPAPAAGGTVAAFVLFADSLELTNIKFWFLGPLMLVLALLMVSTVHYPKDRIKAVILAPRNAFRTVLICGLGIAVFGTAGNHSPAILLFPLAFAYVSFGVVEEIHARMQRRSRQELPRPQPEGPSEEPPGPPNTGDLR